MFDCGVTDQMQSIHASQKMICFPNRHHRLPTCLANKIMSPLGIGPSAIMKTKSSICFINLLINAFENISTIESARPSSSGDWEQSGPTTDKTDFKFC